MKKYLKPKIVYLQASEAESCSARAYVGHITPSIQNFEPGATYFESILMQQYGFELGTSKLISRTWESSALCRNTNRNYE